MKRFQKVLAFVDDTVTSYRSLERARSLQEQTGASVTVMRVIEELDDAALGSAECTALRHTLVGETRDSICRFLRIPWDQFDWDVRVEMGRASLRIIQTVLSEGHDLVIKVARGKRQGRAMSFGTTAMHLIRKNPCPTWIVPDLPQTSRPRILAAINPGSPEDEYRLRLARSVVDHAVALSRHLDAELHVAHAWHPTAELTLRRHFSSDVATEYVNATRREAGEALERALLPFRRSGIPVQAHLPRGEPPTSITELSNQLKAEAIVMGNVGRSGIEGLLIGEMAEELLMRVNCGIFCVKSEGFVSPVRNPRMAAPNARVETTGVIAQRVS